MNRFVDSHCHLGRYNDPIATLDIAYKAEVITIAVTESPEEFRRLRTRLGPHAGVRIALGAHPLRAASLRRELARFERLLMDTEWVGEIGLDYSRHADSTNQIQRAVFETILAMPLLRHKVISVHCRRAERDAIAMLSAARVNATLHWWTGPPSLIDTALAAGMWFSVNEAMFSTHRGRAAIGEIPLNRLITETDGPYSLTGGRPAAPADVRNVIQRLARTWQVNVEDARSQVWNNMIELHRSVIPTAPFG